MFKFKLDIGLESSEIIEEQLRLNLGLTARIIPGL